jgi:Ssp1 endopeptidase immunity protein Rap1a
VQPIQAIKIVQKWLNDHPEELHAPADALCFLALAKAFPNPDFSTTGLREKRLREYQK